MDRYSTLPSIKYYSTNDFRRALLHPLKILFVMHVAKVPFPVAFVELKMSQTLCTERM